MKELNLSKTDKLIYSVFLGLLIIIAVLGILRINNYLFPLISLTANIFLISIYRIVKKALKVEFTKYEKIAMLLIIFGIYLFYFISILSRNFIYYWDFSCYYDIQTALENSFTTSIFAGIKSFVGTTWSGEYGNFISFFPEIIFRFTSRTVNAFVLSCVTIYIPYIIIAISILIKKVISILKLKEWKKFSLLVMASCILFPVLHAMFIYGQPDLFGLAFIFLIIALTIDYDFKKIEPIRLATLLIISFMLVITRRWYMYWVVSYYVCYGLKIIISNIKEKDELKKVLKNCIMYLLIAIIFFSVTLFPLFKNIIANNYANSYSYYMGGGFWAEVLGQISHLGYIYLAIIITGLIYGIIKKQYRISTILFALQYFMMIFMFTRIQNMGLHHSLILLPVHLYFTYLFILFILQQKKNMLLSIGFIIIILANFICGFTSTTNTKVFTDINLTTPEETDYYKIEEIAKWFKNNLDSENTAYMITHNNNCNPDKFRHFYVPDVTIQNYLSYGSAIIGVHKFPTELVTAKYVITTMPFESVSIEAKYNQVFNELVKMGKFKLKEKFEMNKGYEVLIYERIKAVDLDETNLYIDALKEESKQYSNLYLHVIENFVEDYKLK